ncbi:MAG: DUF4296 domain-containing protein [Bacteroidia bacterium]|jgi:hypothetical protein|nr:DUF4296 domain-containing protein [Bacteroidia bacterium]
MIRTKVILVCLITLNLLVGCTSDKDKLPDGILTKNEMVLVTADIQLLESAQKQLNVSILERNKMRDTSYQILFNKYGIDSSLYDSSLHVYSRHPQLMAEIMERVAEQINKKK